MFLFRSLHLFVIAGLCHVLLGSSPLSETATSELSTNPTAKTKATTMTPMPTTTIPKSTTSKSTTIPPPTTTTHKPTTTISPTSQRKTTHKLTTPKPTTPRSTTIVKKPKATTQKPTTTPTTATHPRTTTSDRTTTTPQPTTTSQRLTTTKPTFKSTTLRTTTSLRKPTTQSTTTQQPSTKSQTQTTTKPTTTLRTTTATPTTLTPTTIIPTTTNMPTPSTPDPRANTSICYGDLGCYDNFPPFNNAFLDLPRSPQEINTTFTLYSRKNQKHDEGQLLNYTDMNSFTGSLFNKTKLTKVIIHGFSNDLNSPWLHDMKNEFLKTGDFNVIIVGWGNGASFPDYAQAVANTRVVATQTERTIKALLNLGAKLEDFHLIGHSLGAHASGFVGYLLKGKLTRITGLDPAFPDYDTSPKLIILDQSDAKYVDVIHSNGEALAFGGAGMYKQSGHIDFYLNGGKTQPGCKDGIGSFLSSITHGTSIQGGLACSHGRSHGAFIESINSQCPFTAYPCDSYDRFQAGHCLTCGIRGCSVLGYYSDQYNTRGNMYLNTLSKSPLCGYHYSVTVKGAENAENTKGKISLRLRGKWGDSGFVAASKSDQSLTRGGTFSHILVSPEEVGDVESVTIKYEKKSGFWFGTGVKDTYAVEKVDVVSGENGSKYTFCLIDKVLNHGTEVKTVKSSIKFRC